MASTKTIWDKIYQVKSSLYKYLENEGNTSNIQVLSEWYTFSSWIYSLYRKSFPSRQERKAFEKRFARATNNQDRVDCLLSNELVKVKFTKYSRKLWKASLIKEKRKIYWRRLLKPNVDHCITRESVETIELEKIVSGADGSSDDVYGAEEVRILEAPKFPGYQENESLQGITTKVRLGNHAAKRRQLVAQDNLAIGELIADESAICAWLSPTLYHNYCSRCFLLLPEKRITCRGCKTCNYCSLDCFRRALKEYHQKECGFMDMLKNLSICHFALRLMIILGPKKVVDYHCERDSVGTDGLMFDEAGDSVRTFLNLESSANNVPQSDLLAFTCTSMFTCFLIKEMKFFTKEKLQDKPLIRALISMMIIISRNIFTLYDHSFRMLSTRANPDVLVEGPCREIGYGLFYKTSLFNHSCRPNAHAVFFGSKILVITTRDIPKETEITISYGASYPEMRLEERQNKLQGNFYFNCLCEQCQSDIKEQEEAKHCPECGRNKESNDSNGTEVEIIGDDGRQSADSGVVAAGSPMECLRCHAKQKSEQKIEKTRNNALTIYNKGRRLVYKEDFRKASKYLKKAEKLFRQVSDQWYVYAARDDLVTCYRYMECYEQAYFHSLENLKLRVSLFGKESFNYLNSLLIVIDLSRKCGHLKESEESPLAKELYDIHGRVIARQVRIVEYSHNYYLDFLIHKEA